MKAKQWIIIAGIVMIVMLFGMYSYVLGFNEKDPSLDTLISDAELLDDEQDQLSEAVNGLRDFNKHIGYVEYSLSALDPESQTIVVTVRFSALRNNGNEPVFVGRVGSDPADAVQAVYLGEDNHFSAQLTIPVNEWNRIYYGSTAGYDANEYSIILEILPKKELYDRATASLAILRYTGKNASEYLPENAEDVLVFLENKVNGSYALKFDTCILQAFSGNELVAEADVSAYLYTRENVQAIAVSSWIGLLPVTLEFQEKVDPEELEYRLIAVDGFGIEHVIRIEDVSTASVAVPESSEEGA